MNSSRIALSKVLLPVDFSDKSVEAARYAVKLLKSFRPQVTLLHVLTQHYGFDMPGLENEELTRFLAEDESNARTQLEKFLRPDFRDLNMRRVLIKGDPAQRIVEYAHSEKFNLIIMPTHGRGPFRRRLLGSVTAKVLHDVKTPVLTGVHMEKAGVGKSTVPRRIICGLNLSSEAAGTLRWAARLASRYKARLTAVHVIPSFEFPGEGYGPPGWTRLATKKPTKALSTLLRRCSIDAQIHLEAGNVPEALSSTVTELRANLLVIGRGPVAATGGRLSTNAYAIIRTCPCPVVSV